ncbi:gfo/Idh/MocA family oxidoreductase [Shewanella sp. Choline-02u-19]|uniref:Gfo/Idh/MocA family protein n=1 Tax=unclassified Shewanella TaxID=196818 RepID=UPI000C32C62C|nr:MULTISPECIES: Gfo/Idh/MocA family oxidoreductase [unclassified Shewanella]PKG56458.1 gfo/Idh/MocA family oxidoreductase [Shewanella sp. GutDb-MelDb]PKH54606.1 gfo/Idh/MocA family oxidoreductase [Shewanella sp. Bg11-22]PKI28664.1 gfo/Idh/MocA family oxidoreductase [Shewanella sp. Choline-02u-19]
MKWGIIGTSFISGIMAEAINGDDKSELYAVAGRTQTTLDEFAKSYAAQKSYTDYDALINDRNVDIVYIALPNHLHHEFVVKAAAAGKAILCEKSLSIDMEKTEIALAAVRKHQVFFAEGLMYLCHPYIEKALSVLASGAIGEIKAIQGSYVAAISQFVNADSKGALYNLGCYPMSLAYLILKQSLPAGELMDYSVSAIGRKGADNNISESSATFRFANKANVQIHTAEDYGLKHGFTVLGSKGCLTFNSNPWLPGQSNEFEVETYEANKETVTVDAAGDAFFYQVRAIREAFERGDKSLQAPKATPESSADIMRLLTDWESSTQLS